MSNKNKGSASEIAEYGVTGYIENFKRTLKLIDRMCETQTKVVHMAYQDMEDVQAALQELGGSGSYEEVKEIVSRIRRERHDT